MLLTAQKNNRFATIFAAAVILTASFDIFLAFDVAGFTVRAAQILAIGLYVPALWNAFKERKIALPHGWKPLLVCLAALFFVILGGVLLLLTALHFGERVLAVEVLDVSETAGKSEASLLYREVNAQ